jgi:hypothetical protein
MAYPGRTTPAQVASIIQVAPGEVAGGVLNEYINAANNLVTLQCTNLPPPTVLDTATLELIERYLSAHFYAVNNRRTAGAGVSGAVNVRFDPFKPDIALEATIFGQQAMLQDVSGNLAAYNNSLKTVKKNLPVQGFGFVWLGERHHHHHH